MNEQIDAAMDPFRYMVRRLIEINSPTLIENGSPAHAQILLEEMFAHAKQSAYVYCGKISKEVWGCEAVANAVRDAINRPNNSSSSIRRTFLPTLPYSRCFRIMVVLSRRRDSSKSNIISPYSTARCTALRTMTKRRLQRHA